MALGKCSCCEVLKAENEHLRKWIDRMMEEKHPDLHPQAEILPEALREPSDMLIDLDTVDGSEKIQFGD